MCLHRKCESSAKEVKVVTLACVVLHNICTLHNDQLPKYWDLTAGLQRSTEVRDMLNMAMVQKMNDSEKEAVKIRSTLAKHFWQEKVNAEEF